MRRPLYAFMLQGSVGRPFALMRDTNKRAIQRWMRVLELVCIYWLCVSVCACNGFFFYGPSMPACLHVCVCVWPIRVTLTALAAFHFVAVLLQHVRPWTYVLCAERIEFRWMQLIIIRLHTYIELWICNIFTSIYKHSCH